VVNRQQLNEKTHSFYLKKADVPMVEEREGTLIWLNWLKKKASGRFF